MGPWVTSTLSFHHHPLITIITPSSLPSPPPLVCRVGVLTKPPFLGFCCPYSSLRPSRRNSSVPLHHFPPSRVLSSPAPSFFLWPPLEVYKGEFSPNPLCQLMGECEGEHPRGLKTSMVSMLHHQLHQWWYNRCMNRFCPILQKFFLFNRFMSIIDYPGPVNYNRLYLIIDCNVLDTIIDSWVYPGPVNYNRLYLIIDCNVLDMIIDSCYNRLYLLWVFTIDYPR